MLDTPGSNASDNKASLSNMGPLRFFQILAFLLTASTSFLFLKQKDIGRENDQLRSSADSVQQALVICTEELKKPDPVAELLCDPATQHAFWFLMEKAFIPSYITMHG